jgi:D-alanine-D-alanine ligase
MSIFPWWSENGGYFDTEYLCDTSYLNDLETVSAQVDFIEHVVNPEKYSRILDVACGPGRTCLELARRGYQNITGVDINSLFLEEAKSHTLDTGPEVKFVHRDMRNLGFSGCFDIVLCVGASIGYFDSDEENETAFKNMADALRPGGTLLLEVWKHLKTEKREPQSWDEELKNGTKALFKTYFDRILCRAHITIYKERPSRRVAVNYRIYSPEELQEMATRFGLIPKIFFLDYWGWTEAPVEDDDTRRVVMVARKPV